MKKCTVERTNKAEMKLEEQNEKAESSQEKLWIEMQLKGPHKQKQTQGDKNRIKRSGQAQLVYVKT